METAITFSDLCRELNRSTVYIRGLQSRFALPIREGSGYSLAYLEFLRVVCYLRILGISEESIRELWHLERKLLHLLHADASCSDTWFLDSCGETTHPERRLLLSNYDLGVFLPAGAIQLGLNLVDRPAELWSGREMGEDEVRVLNEYLKRREAILASIQAELPVLRDAERWGKRQRRG